MADYTILLDALDAKVRLGIHPHEVEPQRVLIDVAMTVRYPAAIDQDRIEAVLDYDYVREGIIKLARDQRFALQETLCEAIVALCFADRRVVEVRVRTMKSDVYPDARIGCEVVRRR